MSMLYRRVKQTEKPLSILGFGSMRLLHDGIPMVDYSSQQVGKHQRAHAETIDKGNFKNFLSLTALFDFDIMLEIKDKEKSALSAIEIAHHDSLIYTGK
jgi:hypothetical protein